MAFSSQALPPSPQLTPLQSTSSESPLDNMAAVTFMSSTHVLPSHPSPPSSQAYGLKRRHSPALSLDLSDLPSLTPPSTPSNTLIITNLVDASIFSAPVLQSLREALESHTPIHSFIPLRSFRRIILVFHSTQDAISMRAFLEQTSLSSSNTSYISTTSSHTEDDHHVLSRIKVYFGENTDLKEKERHLCAPPSQKLFFISPPPSPPVGWQSRDEEPPNKDVHAEDLVKALDRLNSASIYTNNNAGSSEEQREEEKEAKSRSITNVINANGSNSATRRSRSGTVGTIVFDPADHGASEDLPAIAVEDTTTTIDGQDDYLAQKEDEMEIEMTVDEIEGLEQQNGMNKAFIHTARPPVELMEH